MMCSSPLSRLAHYWSGVEQDWTGKRGRAHTQMCALLQCASGFYLRRGLERSRFIGVFATPVPVIKKFNSGHAAGLVTCAGLAQKSAARGCLTLRRPGALSAFSSLRRAGGRNHVPRSKAAGSSGISEMPTSTTMRAYCHGDPQFHAVILRGDPVFKSACEFFRANPGMNFHMVAVTRDELRRLLRCGAAGVLGVPRLEFRKSRYPKNYDFRFPRKGKIWVVFRRDWCRNALLPELDGRYRPGLILVPDLPGDLSIGDAWDADALGAYLWAEWEKSGSMTPARAKHEAEMATYAVFVSRFYDVFSEAFGSLPATVEP